MSYYKDTNQFKFTSQVHTDKKVYELTKNKVFSLNQNSKKPKYHLLITGENYTSWYIHLLRHAYL
jgi:hypothetical protein